MKLSPHSLIKNGNLVKYHFPTVDMDDLLAEKARILGDKTALTYTHQDQSQGTISYTDLDSYTESIGKWLRYFKNGDSPGPLPPSISFAFENSPEVILLNYAAWRVGWCSVPLDTTRDTLERKIYKLKETNCQLLVCRRELLNAAEKGSITCELPGIVIVEVDNYQELVAIAQTAISRVEPKNMDQLMVDINTHPALILYTSGTTAMPKGAILSLTNLFSNAQSVKSWLEINSNDRWAITLPLHHINSNTFVNAVFLAGGTSVLLPPYSKSQFWGQLANNRITGTSIVPTIVFDQISQTANFEKYQSQLTQLKRIQVGSAPVQPHYTQAFVNSFEIKLIQGYGQTETSLRSTGVPYNLNPDEYNWALESNTLGTELEHTNVSVLDSRGNETLPSELGEICVRGPIIMQGYLNNPKESKEVFKNGWLNSGDTGYWEEHYGKRYFFITGRTKEIINKGGVLISPLAIENTILKTYPTIEHAYVVGVPDNRFGEEIGLIVVGEPGVDIQIMTDLSDKCLGVLKPYEHPVAVVQIDESELPKTSTGKIQRVDLRRIYASHLIEKSRTISTVLTSASESRVFRRVGPEETEVFESAAAIDRDRWGEVLAATAVQFKQRSEHGLLIGCFDHNRDLLGTLSAIRINHADLKHAGKAGDWTSTWDSITGDGTLRTHNHRGDALLMVAVACIRHSNFNHVNTSKQANIPQPINNLTDRSQLDSYLKSNQDPVLAFHYKPKAGYSEGARFIKALPDARPDDKTAAGYCVLVKYPILNRQPTIDSKASIGTQLVEASILYAWQKGINHVYAYSRPTSLHSQISA